MKMAKTPRSTKTSKSPSGDKQSANQPSTKRDTASGAPIEHFHGEKTEKHVGDEGDQEEEALDRNAP